MNILLSSSITRSIKESAVLAEELGLGIEISRFPNFKNITTDFELILKQMKDEISFFKGYKSLHAMFSDLSPGSRDPEIREITEKRHKQSLRAAKEIGANIVVFHTGNKGMKHKGSQEQFLDASIKFWSRFIKEFEDEGIMAVMENVHERIPSMITNLIDGVNSPNLKASLDTGHANLFSNYSVDEWIKSYSSRLHHMHIHNNCGEDDEHNSLLKGTINFDKVFTELKKQQFNPIIVFEMFEKQNLIESLDYYKKVNGEKTHV